MRKINEYRHIVWDFNGTLIDDLDIGIEIQKIMMHERGIPPITREKYLDSFDFPMRDWYKKNGYDVGEYDKLAGIWSALYDERVEKCALPKGAKELLDAIRDVGIGQSIVSASHTVPLFRSIERLGIGEYFDNVYGLQNNLAHGKAHLCARLLDDTGISGGDMLLIGDTTQDFLTAQTLGSDCALVACGHQSFSRLKAVNDCTFEDLAQLRYMLFD